MKPSVQILQLGNRCEIQVTLTVPSTTLVKLDGGLVETATIIGTSTSSPQPYQTWADRWLAYPVICLFPAERREEWIGDLYEVRNGLLERNYPRWIVNLIITGRTLILISSALKISLTDWLAEGFRQSS